MEECVCTGDPDHPAIYLNATRPFAFFFSATECNASDNTQGKVGESGWKVGCRVEADTCRLFCVYGPQAKVRGCT